MKGRSTEKEGIFLLLSFIRQQSDTTQPILLVFTKNVSQRTFLEGKARVLQTDEGICKCCCV